MFVATVIQLDPREHDAPCTYLLAIWSPGKSTRLFSLFERQSLEVHPLFGIESFILIIVLKNQRSMIIAHLQMKLLQ